MVRYCIAITHVPQWAQIQLVIATIDWKLFWVAITSSEWIGIDAQHSEWIRLGLYQVYRCFYPFPMMHQSVIYVFPTFVFDIKAHHSHTIFYFYPQSLSFSHSFSYLAYRIHRNFFVAKFPAKMLLNSRASSKSLHALYGFVLSCIRPKVCAQQILLNISLQHEWISGKLCT